MKEKIQGFFRWLERSRFAPLAQFIKFGLVGVSNTLISYMVEMVCYYGLFRNAGFEGLVGALGSFGLTVAGEQVKVVLTTTLAFIAGTINSFFLNSRFVFRAQRKRTTGQIASSFGKTTLCYGLTGLLLSPALRLWLVGLGIPYWGASLLSLIVTIPLNFLLNKCWAFADKSSSKAS